MLAVVELCWSGNVICAAKIRLCRPCQFFHFQPPSESSWRSRRVCSVFGPLCGAGETDLQSRCRGARRGPSYGPSPSRRVLRIWGHWAHLMTTVHRGRSSDGGFVAQFLPVRKSVSRLGAGSVPALFSGLVYIFRDRVFGRTKILLIESSRLHSRLPSTPNKKHLVTRRPRSGTYLGPNSPNEPQSLPAWST